jgi:UrcA family protein
MHALTQHPAKLIGFAAASITMFSAMMFFVNSHASAPETLNVSYADLDVNTSDGAAVLYHRIRVAAAEVCSIYDARDLAHTALRRSCTDRAVAHAVASVNLPALADQYLTQIHAEARALPALVAAR